MEKKTPLWLIGSDHKHRSDPSIELTSETTAPHSIRVISDDTLSINLAGEFLTTALFSTVASSMVTSRATGRTIRFHGDIATYLPGRPEIFLAACRDNPTGFFSRQRDGSLDGHRSVSSNGLDRIDQCLAAAMRTDATGSVGVTRTGFAG